MNNDPNDPNNPSPTDPTTIGNQANVDSQGAPLTASPPTPTFPLPEQNPPVVPPVEEPVNPESTNPLIGSINTATPQAGPAPLGPVPTNEPAPTDLSQLTGNGDQPPPPEVYVPPVTSPENLVLPSTPTSPEAISTASNHSTLMPKLLIGGGVVVVILVTVASAYFILGIGKPAQNPSPASLPAQQAPLTNPPPALSPPPTPEAAVSASPTASASASPSSAIERLRQRQSPTPTP